MMKLKLNAATLKKSILLFWMLYFLLIFISNTADALKTGGLIPDSFSFASGNYAMIEQVTSVYNTPGWIRFIMFVGVIIWEAIAAWAFFQAFRGYKASQSERSAIYQAYTIAFALWAAFILMDEFFLAFQFERTHQMLMITQLVTLFAIELLPDSE